MPTVLIKSKRRLRQLGCVLIVSAAIFLSSCNGFFVDPALSSIAVTPSTPSITIGNTQQMTATGTYEDGSTQTVTTKVSWTTSDSTVATVGSTGLVTGVSTGTASITATSGSISGATTVTVTVANLASLSISPTSASISSGQTQAFYATGHLKDGSIVDITDAVTWSSSNTSAAVMSSSGIATGQTVTSSQTTNITATSGSVTSNTAVLTVNP